MKDPRSPRLADKDSEQARRVLVDAVLELQATPAAQANYVTGLALADGVITNVDHGLEREPLMLFVSPPRGPTSKGMIEEIRTTVTDRAKTVLLRATGYTATVVVDVMLL